MKKVKGLGRTCAKCHVSTGTQEDCVEVEGKVYHMNHNPLRARPNSATQTNCHVGQRFSGHGTVH